MPDTTTLPAHAWVAAANVPLSEKSAKTGQRRGNVTIDPGLKVEVLEITCSQCRRSWPDVANQPCVIGIHLIGGPIGTRKKRKGHLPDL